MPGPGDPETWGPCTNHPNDPRTPDDTVRLEEKEAEIIQARLIDIGWFREAIAEADDEQIEQLMKLVAANVCKEGADIANHINRIVSEYVVPNDWEVGEAIEMEEEPDDA